MTALVVYTNLVFLTAKLIMSVLIVCICLFLLSSLIMLPFIDDVEVWWDMTISVLILSSTKHHCAFNLWCGHTYISKLFHSNNAVSMFRSTKLVVTDNA